MSAREPLNAEERLLAERLARLDAGVQPSPALDARILAAARSAAAMPADAPQATTAAQRRARWPVAMGLAASALLAVGIAWQLRPLQESPQILGDKETPAAASSSVDAAPALPAMAEPIRDGTATESIATAPAPEAFPALAQQDAAATAPTATARKPAPQSAPAESPRRERAEGYAPPPPPAPPAPVSAPPVATPSSPSAQAPDTVAVAAAQRRRAASETREQGAAQRADAGPQLLLKEDRRAAGAARQLSAQDEVPERAAGAASPIQRTDLQLPVPEDAKLSSDDWIERIRLRRDLGDRASAAASLRLYVQEHPFRKVPEDLQPLLTE